MRLVGCNRCPSPDVPDSHKTILGARGQDTITPIQRTYATDMPSKQSSIPMFLHVVDADGAPAAANCDQGA